MRSDIFGGLTVSLSVFLFLELARSINPRKVEALYYCSLHYTNNINVLHQSAGFWRHGFRLRKHFSALQHSFLTDWLQ